MTNSDQWQNTLRAFFWWIDIELIVLIAAGEVKFSMHLRKKNEFNSKDNYMIYNGWLNTTTR